jgi:hypothetical protein
VNVVNSTIASNTSGAGGSGGAGGAGGPSGGAPGLQGPGGAGGGGSDGGSGSGLWLGSDSVIAHATIASNPAGAVGAGGPGGTGNPTAAAGSPGGVADGAGIETVATVTVRNTVFAGNGTAALLGGGCSGDVTDPDGGNVAFASRDCPEPPMDSRLGPLARNGGPTQTMALRAGSPAIDLIRPTGQGCAATDQRGAARPIGGRCDAGAYEAPSSVRPGGSTPSLGSPRSKRKKKRLRLTYAVSGPGKLVVRLFMKGYKRVGGATARPAKAVTSRSGSSSPGARCAS